MHMQEQDADQRPLKGIRVLDLSWIVAGPQATRILADFGAEVIRIEYEGRPDAIRGGRGGRSSGMFNNLNRNKLSATLNLNHPKGVELFLRLVKVSDVVVENFSSRVMERWGLTYEAMAAVNPGIIYISLSGFGHAGRNRDYVTWGPTAQALSGLTLMSGLPDAPPAGWGYSYLDHTAGYYGAMAILMALYHRNRTGLGQYIDLAQVETGMVLAGPAILDFSVNGRPYRRPGNPPGNRSEHPRVAPHNTYRCRGEDRWIAIAVFTDAEWQALCRVMGDPDWSRDSRFATNSGRVAHEDELDQRIEAWTASYDPYDLMYLLQGPACRRASSRTSPTAWSTTRSCSTAGSTPSPTIPSSVPIGSRASPSRCPARAGRCGEARRRWASTRTTSSESCSGSPMTR